MKKVIYEKFGNPTDVLEVVEEDSKSLQEGEARIDILRSPINSLSPATVCRCWPKLPQAVSRCFYSIPVPRPNPGGLIRIITATNRSATESPCA